MATFTTLTLDTTAPASPAVDVESGATTVTTVDVSIGISTGDGSTAGYQVKIYGDVDDSFAPSEYRATEGNAPWVSFAATKNIRLSSSDGSKTVRIKIRDDVGNASSEATDTVTLDTTAPTPNITVALSNTKVSKVTGFNSVTFSWESDSVFDEYMVRVVPSSGSDRTQGTLIPTTNGSANTSGTAGGYPASTNIQTTINGADLETASATDGAKIIKVFVRDPSNNWSS